MHFWNGILIFQGLFLPLTCMFVEAKCKAYSRSLLLIKLLHNVTSSSQDILLQNVNFCRGYSDIVLYVMNFFPTKCKFAANVLILKNTFMLLIYKNCDKSKCDVNASLQLPITKKGTIYFKNSLTKTAPESLYLLLSENQPTLYGICGIVCVDNLDHIVVYDILKSFKKECTVQKNGEYG